MSQSQDILEYLQDGNSLTSLEALKMFNCFRLASRISDLKKLGIEIHSETIETETGKLVSRYWIGEPRRTEQEEAVSDNNLAQEEIINRRAFEKDGQFAFLG